MSQQKSIRIDNNHSVFNRQGLFYKEFDSDLKKVRYYTLLILQKAPESIKELNLLEQQISELLKNAVKHGNKNIPEKKVKVWYTFTDKSAHLIVEDEGTGFKDIEKWNDFNAKRLKLLQEGNIEEVGHYVSWRSQSSDEHDGGNALFAALEYWNGGFIYSEARNCVGAIKHFSGGGLRGLDSF